jgi:hypothetical protein
MRLSEQRGGGAATGGRQRGGWLLLALLRTSMARARRSVLLPALLLAACGGDATGPELPGGATSQPRPGAGDVSVAATVRITFRRDVQLPSDTANAIWLERDGTRIAGLVTQPSARELVLTPIDVLDPAASYTVHIGTGLTDTQGVVPSSSFEFTTGGLPIPAANGQRLMAHIRALADDSMAGRAAGTAEELKAANYIRTEFGRYGLSAYADGQWLQTVPPTGFVGNSQNVIGVLRGEGSLRDEWVVIGAHYDHVGTKNGLIYNGADDNASGTAGVLELARLLAQYRSDDGFGADNRRSLMFIAFGAEERGLIGSYYYCNHPLVALANVSAMINLDMIGRLRADTLYVIGENTGLEWAGLLRRYDQTFNYVAMADAGTDYRCFKLAGRPVMSLFTGLHPDYHQPTDDPDLINVPGMTEVAQLALDLAVNTTVRPGSFTR